MKAHGITREKYLIGINQGAKEIKSDE